MFADQPLRQLVSSRPTQQGRPEVSPEDRRVWSECREFQADPPNKAGRKQAHAQWQTPIRSSPFQADPPNKAGRKPFTGQEKTDVNVAAFQADPPNKAGRKLARSAPRVLV